MEHPFLYTIEEIFGNKANSTIRMYAIKIASNVFISFSTSPSRSASFRFFRTFLLLTEKKLLIILEDAFVRFGKR